MKNLKFLLSFLLLASFVFLSCNEEDDNSNEEILEVEIGKARYTGASTIVEINGIMCLAVMYSPEEAMSYGYDEETAYEMFAAPGFNPCTTEFTWAGAIVSCVGEDDCDVECVLKRWDSNTKSWINHGSASALASGNTWKCFCE